MKHLIVYNAEYVDIRSARYGNMARNVISLLDRWYRNSIVPIYKGVVSMNVDDELRDEEMKRFYEETGFPAVRLIEGHCGKCGKVLFEMYGEWETWMEAKPIFCLDCFRGKVK